MKVITIKEPWATLIAEGYKEYEFRVWKTNYRGEVLIHAGKSVDQDKLKKLFSQFLIEYFIIHFVSFSSLLAVLFLFLF